ncbi:MAG: cyanophycin synthetase family protein, partial [Bacillota bacterium]
MKILRQNVFDGPNVHSHYPVIEMRLDLEELDGLTTQDVPGFVDRLLRAMPTLREHYCSLGRPGGFAQRLLEGTYFGHVLEHLTLELEALAGMRVIYGKTRYAGAPRLYNVVYEYTAREAGLAAGRLALEILTALAAGEERGVADAVAQVRETMERCEPGPS